MPLERYKKTPQLADTQKKIRDECYQFALQQAQDIDQHYQSNTIENNELTHLSNRELDLWEPLIAILKSIDSTDLLGNLELMSQLSQDLFIDKSHDSMEDNETAQIIQGLLCVIDSDISYNIYDEGVRKYKTKEVLDFLNALNEPQFEYLQLRQLTSRLKRLGIRAKQTRFRDGDRETGYFINEKHIESLVERFNVLSLNDD